MSPLTRFGLAFGLTLVLLVLVAATGLRAKRAWHITFVAGAVACLAATIWYALKLGRLYDLKAAGAITPIHLTLAKITTASYALPIFTGLRTIFIPATRKLHRKVAFFVLGMTLLTAITGTLMMWLAPRIG